jgi:hypothetical protein
VSTTPQGIDTEERRKAARNRERLAKETEHIQGQKNWSAVGKQAQLARAVVKAIDQNTQLGGADTGRVTGGDAEIRRGLFGHTRPDDSRIISIRDAADRAGRVKTPEEAAKLMNRAELHGDTVLLQALAWECAERRSPVEPAWDGLFKTWAAQQPGGTEALDQLAIIDDELHDVGHRLLREHAFGVGPLPAELRGLSIGDLRRLAAQADTITQENNDDEPGDTASAARAAFDSRFR